MTSSPLAVCLLLTSSVALAQSRTFPLADDQLMRFGIVLAQPERVSEMEIASAPATVVVPPARQALVSAPIDGRLARVFVAAGEMVTEGQALAEIEAPDFLSWQREYLEATLEYTLADAQHSRDRALYEEGIIAERRMQEAAARARAAAARLDQARRQLEITGITAAEVEQLRQGAELAGRFMLRAPLDGVVLESYATVGARVIALDAVMRIGDLSTLWLELQVPQEMAAKVRPGMHVRVHSGDREVTSTVTTVGRFVDAAAQTVLVRAETDDADSGLRIGQFLSARIVVGIDEQPTLALPVAALTRHAGASFVFAQRDGQIEVLPIEVLADDGRRVYITGPLSDDTRVVVEGISALKSLWLAGTDGS